MTSLDTLLAAIKASDIDAVAAVLDEDRDLVQALPASGPSPILLAAYVGSDEIVALLRERGGELDLHEAAALGDVARLSLLALTDANRLNSHNADGWTPLHLAGYFGQKLAVDLLLARGADVNALSTNATHNTPLHAALAGATEYAVVERLLASGADATAVGGGGVTPLHLAASRGAIALIDLLQAHGAVSTQTDDGRTPADLASERGHAEAFERLNV